MLIHDIHGPLHKPHGVEKGPCGPKILQKAGSVLRGARCLGADIMDKCHVAPAQGELAEQIVRYLSLLSLKVLDSSMGIIPYRPMEYGTGKMQGYLVDCQPP